MARGIEDLQVVYNTMNAAGDDTFDNTAPDVVANDPTTLVKGVRVTVGARVLTMSLAGQSTSTNAAMGTAQTAIRGTLSRMVIIPSALMAFKSAIPPASPLWPGIQGERL